MNKHYFNRYQKFIKTIKKLGERAFDGYTETHHIVPKCLKGTDDIDNLLVLTLREHFLAHWLLWRAYPNYLPLASAFLQMNNKNNKLKNKGFQGRISSRTYEQLKTNVYDQLKKHTTDKVRVRDENGNLLTLSKQEYANQSEYKFHTTGKVYVLDIEKNSWVYVTSDEYQKNKHKYKIRVHEIKFQFLDTTTNEILKMTKNEASVKNKEYGFKRLKHIQNKTITCIDDDGNKYTISLEEYKNNNHTSIHSHMLTNKVVVYDTKTNKNVKITKEEYDLDHNRYFTSTKGKVLAKDKNGNNVLVSKTEFDSGEYVGQTKGLRLVFDKSIGSYVQVTEEMFNNNRSRYQGPNKGKVNVINKLTGERKQISKDQFDKELYVGLGNKKFLFLCLNKLTNKEKLINIYEWHLVKDQYKILDQEKFNKANKAK